MCLRTSCIDVTSSYSLGVFRNSEQNTHLPHNNGDSNAPVPPTYKFSQSRHSSELQFFCFTLHCGKKTSKGLKRVFICRCGTYLSIQFEHICSWIISEQCEPLINRFFCQFERSCFSHSENSVSQNFGNRAVTA